jgi:hypothetical protein
MGDWAAEAHHLSHWDARIAPHTPMGTILFEPHGHLRIELRDYQGWKPFIAVGGMQAGRSLQATLAYGFDGGSTLVTSTQGQWDPGLTLYEFIGATSDGTLDAAGMTAYISLAALDGEPWNIDFAFVGWTEIP